MNSEKIVVAQVMGKMNSGGVESVIMNYYRYIDKNKIQFHFICDASSTIPQKEEIEKLGGKVIIVPNYQHVFSYIKKLIQVFKENKYLIVHSNLNALSVIPLFCAKVADVPVRIAHSHSTSNKKEKFKNIIKKCLKPFSKKFATHYFACTNHAGLWLFGEKILNNPNYFVINNAIDYQLFSFNARKRKEIRKSLDVGENNVLIGNVGRFVDQKNQIYLINLLAKLTAFDNKYKLLLIGDGPLELYLKKSIKDLNLSNNVIILSSRKDVYEYYSAMDVFVFPSLYEGLGMVAIEAQCNGLVTLISENVPDDVLLSKYIKRLCLNNINDWVNAIHDCYPRSMFNNGTYLDEDSYNIICQCKKLEEEYIEMVRKQKKSNRMD